MANLTIALAGNPNAGKSTIFNGLTGLRQHTGNWPGKTVARKTGTRTYEGQTIEFVDLPGTYSLAAYSPDETIARDYLLDAHPDAVICVVDATNLERHLYLAVQILELGLPLVVALNMSDQARAMGIDVDCDRLSRLLAGAPVVPTSANRGEGLDRLLATTITYAQTRSETLPLPVLCDRCPHCHPVDAFRVDYGPEIEEAIRNLDTTAQRVCLAPNGNCQRWTSLGLLEGEPAIAARVAELPGGTAMVNAAEAEAIRLQTLCGDEVDMITADRRYSVVSDISQQVIWQETRPGLSLSERLDLVATHRLLGLPVFLVVMYLVFRLVIDVSAPYLDWVDSVINGPIARGLVDGLGWLGAPAWLHSLAVDGIVAGVGGVLTFVPGLVVLFLFLALLEDSGYMARAAFVMDRFMQVIGLQGKSVIPLILGFGCAVPAVYATRTIANRRDRLLTALLIPFMSCSARLPVYVVFALAFFGARAGTVIWLMYVLGVAVAILMGFILSRTVLRANGRAAFMLELPPYRLPTARGLLLHTWDNTREFVEKAGTLILAFSVILWFLLNLPWGVADRQESLYGRVSAAMAPVLQPAGFGTWETSGSLLSGFIAKELVVSSLSQIYVGETAENEADSSDSEPALEIIVVGFGEATLDAGRTLLSLVPGLNLAGNEPGEQDTALSQALQTRFTPLKAIAFLVFVLLYVPCVATVGAIRQEFGGRRAVTAAIYQTGLAWLGATLTFQGGMLLGLG